MGNLILSCVATIKNTPDVLTIIPCALQIIFPYCPSELAALAPDFIKKIQITHASLQPRFPHKVIINGKTLKQKESFYYWLSYNRSLINKDYDLEKNFVLDSIYNNLCALAEQNKFSKLLRGQQITSQNVSVVLNKFCKMNKVKLTDLFKIKLNEKELEYKICNDKNVQFNLAVSRWIEKNHVPADKIQVTDTEIKKFYDDYKWLFCKAQESSKFYKLNEVKKYIIEEIKRLKYYRLEELLTDPPKVEVIWTKFPKKI